MNILSLLPRYAVTSSRAKDRLQRCLEHRPDGMNGQISRIGLRRKPRAQAFGRRVWQGSARWPGLLLRQT